ncbi:hypothetical protein [Emticicia sp. 17c]|uniref:hypothetical protein n=1 Tax=Emticicia sp. 17c TaxID=3127704 RepID=UPI00301BE98D
MSALNSNLTAANYDLVSALSQDALNANLKALLMSLGGRGIPPITAYYKFNDPSHTSGTTLMTPDEVTAMTNGVDVFSIPDGASNQNNPTYASAIMNLANAGFAYAFQAAIGVPPEVAPSQLPDMILLGPSSSKSSNANNPQVVTYYTYYQSFQIMELAYGWNLATVSQTYQNTYGEDSNSDGVPDLDPWTFEWEVNMNLSAADSVAFDNLPPQVQENLRSASINPNLMFSMQQLFLDLNSPRLIQGATAEVFNFPSVDPIYASLNEYISNYWEILKNNGGVVFNTAIRPAQPQDYPPSSIVPTALNFVVSPYSGGVQGLSTLDYLVMSNNRSLPSTIQPFSWDWVNSDSVQGIMSARRDLFISYLNSALSPALSEICLVPVVDVDMDGRFVLSLKSPSTTPVYTSHTTNPVLSISFSQEGSDKAGLMGALYSASVRLDVTSNVTFNGNTIVVTTVMSVYADIYTMLANTKGYALATQNVTTFTMNGVGAGQNNAGILSITASAVNTDLVQNTDKDGAYYGGNIDDPSLWAEGITWGAINDYLDTLNGFTNIMNNLMNGFEGEITNICTNCLGWTFPGAGTYYFSNPQFSNYLDLTVQVTLQ